MEVSSSFFDRKITTARRAVAVGAPVIVAVAVTTAVTTGKGIAAVLLVVVKRIHKNMRRVLPVHRIGIPQCFPNF